MSFDFKFTLEGQSGRARAGRFATPHGELLTPVFAPVGTAATVKAITPAQLSELGASLVLSNTYHLYLRPGDTLVAEMGGLHEFMQWPHPMLTDSGGFQVFSLSQTRAVDADGVDFRSHIDGSRHRFTPERVMAIQENLGADIIMAFDECAEPSDRGYNEQAMQRTHAWLQRCIAAKQRGDQALFGIVQGGIWPDLRARSAEFVASLGLPGNAIGGLSVGESKADMHAMLDVVDPILPADKPRYLMGVGTPEDLVQCIQRGVDIFDCVLPTRLGRNNAVFLRSGGRLSLKNAEFAHDRNPIDAACGCYTCRTFTRAYLRHLIVAKEMLAGTLLSIHNLYTLVHLAKDLRAAILDGSFAQRVAALELQHQGALAK
ncbi:MAG: tRNA guanosine(34) transglycosylase Tgt [Anaerolineales bacterium]|nr:tRNA guanosine(34) transglycosylase Tgt [Anaerolineales bacterium]